MAKEMNKQLDSLPPVVAKWIEECRMAWTCKDLPSGSSSKWAHVSCSDSSRPPPLLLLQQQP